MMWHAAQTRYTEITWPDLCLTDDADDAMRYLEGLGGWLHTVDAADTALLADDDDLRDAADAVYGDAEATWGYRPYAYEIADDARVRAELAERGYVGCEYRDLGKGNGYEHSTVRIWDLAAITLVAADEVAPRPEGALL